MSKTLKDLDEYWKSGHLDLDNLKALCRKYTPQLILDWVYRGLTIMKKDSMIDWHKQSLLDLGLEPAKVVVEKDDVNFAEEDESYGEYFS
jgi:hypothetical protein